MVTSVREVRFPQLSAGLPKKYYFKFSEALWKDGAWAKEEANHLVTDPFIIQGLMHGCSSFGAWF